MRQDHKIHILALLMFLPGILSFIDTPDINQKYLSYIVDLEKQNLELFWKDDEQKIFKDFGTLEKWLNSRNKTLVFAMNGGMYKKDNSPQGLYIEQGKTLAPVDTITNGYGNFYMQPNGIFLISNDNKATICKTTQFQPSDNISFATQSGPLLLIDGTIHPRFVETSKNLNIRNGVGILPNGNILFVMSEEKVNFYEFAQFFKENGCKDALYLDGFVSRTYLPSLNELDKRGNFGVIIGETKTK